MSGAYQLKLVTLTKFGSRSEWFAFKSHDESCKDSLREKSPNAELFLVRIFLIRTEYGDLLRKSQYSIRIQENTDQKQLRSFTLFTQ